MGRLQPDRRHNSRVIRLLPAVDANAPVVTRLQTGESEFRMRRNQVITNGGLVLQKLVIYQHANGVLANVVRTCVALSIAIVPG